MKLTSDDHIQFVEEILETTHEKNFKKLIDDTVFCLQNQLNTVFGRNRWDKDDLIGIVTYYNLQVLDKVKNPFFELITKFDSKSHTVQILVMDKTNHKKFINFFIYTESDNANSELKQQDIDQIAIDLEKLVEKQIEYYKGIEFIMDIEDLETLKNYFESVGIPYQVFRSE